MTAMMTSLSVVLARMILPTSVGEIARFSLGNIPIVICSLAFGPLYGGACGVISDIVGCFFNGYAPYLPLSISPFLVGVLPALLTKAFARLFGKERLSVFPFCVSMVVTNIITSLFWTTLCLSHMQGVDFFVLLYARIPMNTVRTVVEIILLHLIFKNRILERVGVVSE